MAASPPRRRASPPAIPDELFEEFLLRLPPDDPACLLRASLVCKAWSHTVSSPRFRRRLHELHRTPPVLGVLHNWEDDAIPRFIHTTASSFSLAAPDSRSWRALDCRHGRALFLSKGQDAEELLVWEPITGAQQRVPVPAAFQGDYPTAAVFCAMDGCDHRDCFGGHFRVVFVFCVDEEDTEQDPFLTSAAVYSSETGMWGELASMHGEFVMYFEYYSSVLIGRSLYFLSDGGLILEYDLVRHGLTVLDTPDCQPDYMSDDDGLDNRYNLMLAESGALGVSEELGQRLKLWTKEPSYGTDAIWVLSRVINLNILLPNDALVDAINSVQVLGFAHEANVTFVVTVAGLFSIELQSKRVRKVSGHRGFCNLIPVVSFYTPHARLKALVGEHPMTHRHG
ncbi:hypothetical protein CFC21_080658 [Triticum aestivum]|uniref:F-box domain-containing protein n=2 Tax=Triticum aestivum TaxID=4565 RepID=A0A3B6N1F6_WHEAT|nr:uncharacterized protein LOC123123585 [Triticum aestivum]KAF7075928.1 hypothetical protein CFC21_080658 [Triticum aestivum]